MCANLNTLCFRRELYEELGIDLPKDAFELLFVFLQEWLVELFFSSANSAIYYTLFLNQIILTKNNFLSGPSIA